MDLFSFLLVRKTKYIRLRPHQCQGCWECVPVCPEGLLVKMARTRHPHIHLRNSQDCTGCKKCVRACAHAAIEYTYKPGGSRSPRPQAPDQNRVN